MAFAAGDACLLFDNKGRRYLLTLREGSEFQYHHGMLAHDEELSQFHKKNKDYGA